jgi:hypothetical protein
MSGTRLEANKHTGGLGMKFPGPWYPETHK